MRIWVALLPLFLLLPNAFPEDLPTFGSDQPIVGTYYFYWYDHSTSFHITVGGQDSLTHRPPEMESFSYLNEGWHRRELLDMVEAGIDFVMPVYWGDSINKAWAIPGLERMVDAELSLIRDGHAPPKIGMFFDTTALMLEHRHRGKPGDRPNLSTPYGKDLFYAMISDFYSVIPRELWARIDGRALVWLYSAGWVSDYDQSLVEYSREMFAEEFNSSLCLVKDRSWNMDADMEYGWGAALSPVIRDVAAIGPGFDNEGAVKCYGQSPLVRDRLDGHNYRDDWELAMRSGSNILVIETWNELHEGTEICETIELGRLYIDLTRHYAETFKEGAWDRSLSEMDALIELDPPVWSGSPGEGFEVDFTVTNTGWRSWPQRLDLGIFWLALNASNRYNEVHPIQLPRRLLTGESHTETLGLVLPEVPGAYRVLLSTGFLGERLEITALVGETSLAAILILLHLLLAGPARSLVRCPFAGKT